MMPTLPPGSRVILESGWQAVLRARPGDIVAARGRGRELALHRIVWLKGGKVQLCGDNRPLRDPWISRGRIVAVARLGRSPGDRCWRKLRGGILAALASCLPHVRLRRAAFRVLILLLFSNR